MYFSPDGIELDHEDTEKAKEVSSLLERNLLKENRNTSVPVKDVSDTDIYIKYPTIDRIASRFVF